MRHGRLLAVLMILAGVSVSGRGATRIEPVPPPQVVSSGYTVYWGDLHAHTAYSNDAYDLGNTVLEPRDAMAYARDQAHLDFVAITDHAEFTDYDNAHYGNFGSEWQNLKTQCDAANTPDFVTFIGFEFTKAGVTPDGSYVGGGHKCVIFRDNHVPAAPIPAFNPVTNGPTIGPDQLWAQLDAGGYDYITLPHHPAKGKAAWYSFEDDMRTDWNFVNPLRQPVVEIYSVHGNSEVGSAEELVDPFVDSQSVEEALKKWLSNGDPGYQMGILAGTDNHMSKPGSVEELEANVVRAEGHYTGGLTAVLATGRSRGEIFDAITARRTYGTSGPRIGLDFTATAGGRTYVMGESLQSALPLTVTLSVSATGDTANIERIDVIKNGVLFDSVQGLNLRTATWTGADTVTGRAYYRVKVYQRKTRRWDDGVNPTTWHAERAWSSPIWVGPAPSVPPGQPTGLTASVSGSSLTLSWMAPTTAGAPTSYILDAGSAPGWSDLATVETGNVLTAFSANGVGTGRSYIRVRARNAYGTGSSSNEIRVIVGTVVPGAPSGLTGGASGSTVTLSWTVPSTGGLPSAYTIEAGSSPGLTDLANFSTGNTATTFSGSGVADGRYYVRVRATNGAGTGGPSNEFVLPVGCTAPPGDPGGLTTTRNSGGYVAFTWSGAPGRPTTYFLEAGSGPGRVDLANVDLGGTGTVFATSGVSVGTYYVRVRAANACGKSGASNEVVLPVR